MFTNEEAKVMEDFFNICINVAQLLKEPVGSSRRYQMGEVASPETAQKIDGEVRLIRSQRGILVRGGMTIRIETVCSRCLSPVDLPLTFNIEEEFLPKVDVVSGLPLSFGDETGALFINEEHILDLGEIVRQYFILSLPMKPLCRPDCAGLCPVCGSNLNQGVCNCSRQTRNQGWSKLEQLDLGKGNRE